jgi:hypothetical protein
VSATEKHDADHSGRAGALYHRVYSHERFEQAAQALFKLVQEAQRLQPDKPRLLFLDIDGHRNEAGGFDTDMVELQTHFLVGFLARFLTKFSCPLASAKNRNTQDNDVPETLNIQSQSGFSQ